MSMLVVALGLGLGILGTASPSMAVDPIGPFCASINPFGDILQLFALPSGGTNVLLSGRDLTSGVPLAGSAYASGTDFLFTVSGHRSILEGRLLVFDGVINLQTGTGTGKCSMIGVTTGCGTGTTLTYTLVNCP